MHKKISLGLCLTLIILTVAATVSVTIPLTLYGVNNQVGIFGEVQSKFRKINEIDKNVKAYFFGKVNNTALNDALAKGYMSTLDDEYATYYDGKEYKTQESNSKGEGDGLGIVVMKNPDNGFLYITAVSNKSPAEKALIGSGDMITKIGGVDTFPMSIDDAIAAIKAQSVAGVKLTILTNNVSREVTVKAVEFPTDSVDYHFIGTIGFIKIKTFNDVTVPQFKEAIKEMQAKKATAIIFDLRNNGGGTVDSCVKILDILLPSGAIVRTKDKNGKITTDNKSDASEISLPMAVLINGDSASASELFAMNIKDYNKGKLIGTKSFGKGIVQSTFKLFDNTGIKFTTGQIIDKQGTTYHGKGFLPDIMVELTADQQKHFGMLSDSEDPQIMAAVNELTK